MADIKIKRIYSVMPSRAVKDEDLNLTQFRTLAALSIFANQAGVCWPSLATLRDITGRKQSSAVQGTINSLINRGYVRRLEPRDFQKTEWPGKSGRYQVMFTPDDPLPTYEEIISAAPLHGEKAQDHMDGEPNEEGVSGDLMRLARALAHAHAHALNTTTGQPRDPSADMPAAARLARLNVTPEQVRETTTRLCREALASGKPLPLALTVVARSLPIEGDQG